MRLKNKRILVTGGAGFIGSHTVDALIKTGAKVSVIDDFSTGSFSNANFKAECYQQNIFSDGLDEIIEKENPQIVYHFAFNVNVPQSIESPLINMPALVGSILMLKKLKEMGTIEKIVFASSGFIYGNTSELPAKETALIQPLSPYAIAKYAVEQYLEFYRMTFGLPYVVLRYAAVYGPRQVMGAIPDYIRKLSNGQQAEMWGDGNKTRDYVYIEDVVKANIMALNVPNTHSNPIFNVGTGIETTLNEVYGKIAELLGKEAKPIYNQERKGEQLRYKLDSGKIKKNIGWKPKISLNKGLKKLISNL